jgi:hypothetical protein
MTLHVYPEDWDSITIQLIYFKFKWESEMIAEARKSKAKLPSEGDS